MEFKIRSDLNEFQARLKNDDVRTERTEEKNYF